MTPIDYDGVPRITYSDPEVASVGITDKMAAERGNEVTALTYPIGGNGKSQILETQGAVKLIAAASGGPDGNRARCWASPGRRPVGELIAEGQLIYNWEALPSDVAC